MAKDEKFMFYETFLQAIDILPEDKRPEACYKFCRYGIYGELPEDEALKMFCIGVSCSVQKYHGSGGARVGAGRPRKENQKNQIIQKNQNAQTQTKTKTKTQTEIKNKNKPTNDEILAYANNQLGKYIDVDAFVNWYDAQGWLDKNGFPINWKQKVQSWVRKNKIEEADDDDYTSHDDSEWIKKLEQEEPETWKLLG